MEVLPSGKTNSFAMEHGQFIVELPLQSGDFQELY